MHVDLRAANAYNFFMKLNRPILLFAIFFSTMFFSDIACSRPQTAGAYRPDRDDRRGQRLHGSGARRQLRHPDLLPGSGTSARRLPHRQDRKRHCRDQAKRRVDLQAVPSRRIPKPGPAQAPRSIRPASSPASPSAPPANPALPAAELSWRVQNRDQRLDAAGQLSG